MQQEGPSGMTEGARSLEMSAGTSRAGYGCALWRCLALGSTGLENATQNSGRTGLSPETGRPGVRGRLLAASFEYFRTSVPCASITWLKTSNI